MSIMPAAVQLLYRLESVEAAAAAALGFPAPAATLLPPGDEEKGTKGAVDGGSDGAAAAAPAPAPPSLAQRAKPYITNAVILLTVISSAAAWLAIIKGAAAAFRGLPAALSSRAALRSGRHARPPRAAAGRCCPLAVPRPPAPEASHRCAAALCVVQPWAGGRTCMRSSGGWATAWP